MVDFIKRNDKVMDVLGRGLQGAPELNPGARAFVSRTEPLCRPGFSCARRSVRISGPRTAWFVPRMWDVECVLQHAKAMPES